MVATKADALLEITAVDDAGATASVSVNAHVKLSELLRKGLKALGGDPAAAADYVLVINGTLVTDLDLTVAAAGLVSGSEVAIMAKDINRG